eukprot:scaffold2830_cov123-Isochrysis_galbana.AAC.21
MGAVGSMRSTRGADPGGVGRSTHLGPSSELFSARGVRTTDSMGPMPPNLKRETVIHGCVRVRGDGPSVIGLQLVEKEEC